MKCQARVSMLLCLLLPLVAAPVGAVAMERTFTVQGTVLTASGVAADGTFDMVLMLHASDSAPTPIWTQGSMPVVVAGGVFEAELGPLDAGVIENNPSLWLGVTVNGLALDRRPLRAVPQALRAGTADVAGGLQCSGCVSENEIGLNAVGPDQLQAAAVTSAKLADVYAGSATPGGPATGLACASPCVDGAEIIPNPQISGTLKVSGGVNACTDNVTGCAILLSESGLYDHNDGFVNVQVPDGLRVRSTTNGAWKPAEFGGGTSYGALSVQGGLSVSADLAVTGSLACAGCVGPEDVSFSVATADSGGVALSAKTAENALALGGNAANAFMRGAQAESPSLAPGATLTVSHGFGTKAVFVSLLVSDDGGSTYRVVSPGVAGATPPKVFGDGSDGAYTATGNSTVNTVRSALSGSVTAGSTTVALSTVSGFAVDDKVLIIQMQGSGVGTYEIVDVTGVSGSSLVLGAGLVSTYSVGGNNRAQAVKVMQFTDVNVPGGSTLSPPAWDGSTGGVLAMLVSKTLSVSGTLHANARGYRGGAGTGSGGAQGESYGQTGAVTASANAGGGGGGQGISGGCGRGGGGGGYGGGGSNGNGCGSNIGSGGGTYGDAAFAKLYLGSGGGGGGQSGCGGNGGAGGTGGGIVFVTAAAVVNGGAIRADGTAGGNHDSGAGGAGSGGSVRVRYGTYTGSGASSVDVGPASDGDLDHGCDSNGNGGKGGVGRLVSAEVPQSSLLSGSLDVLVSDANTVLVTNGTDTEMRVRVVVGAVGP